MPLSRHLSRAVLAISCAGALPVPAAAQPKADASTRPAGPTKKEIKKQCLDAHAEGQELRKRSALQAARDSFERCAIDACPTAVRSDCVTWFGEVERAQPSIVVKALDAGGKETTRVATLVDGKRTRETIDGLPIVLDPGPHTLRFENEEGAALDQALLLAEGERNKVVTADFTRPLEPYRLTVPTILLGSVSIVGLGFFIGFGAAGKGEESDLEETCAPRCAQEDADSMRTKYVVADVALVTSILAAGGALTFFFLQERGPAPYEKPATTTRLQVWPGGVGVAGTF